MSDEEDLYDEPPKFRKAWKPRTIAHRAAMREFLEEFDLDEGVVDSHLDTRDPRGVSLGFKVSDETHAYASAIAKQLNLSPSTLARLIYIAALKGLWAGMPQPPEHLAEIKLS